MNNAITTKQFVGSLLLNGSNTIIWLYFFITTLKPKTFLFLTSINGDLNSIYLLLCLICDISNYCFSSVKLDCLKDFLRNKLSHIINTISYLVTILFWGLFLMGQMEDDMDTIYNIFFNIYEHIIITIIVILDIIIAEHQRHFFSKITLAFIYIYLFLYGIGCGIVTFVFDKAPYPFLQKLKYYIIIIYCINFIFIAFLCYLFHVFIYKMKDKCTNKGNILINERIEPDSNRETNI